jgi:glycerol-3-phosphate dehydrogenase
MAIKEICQQNNINMDITEFVDAVLNHQKSPEIAFRELWRKMV